MFSEYSEESSWEASRSLEDNLMVIPPTPHPNLHILQSVNSLH